MYMYISMGVSSFLPCVYSFGFMVHPFEKKSIIIYHIVENFQGRKLAQIGRTNDFIEKTFYRLLACAASGCHTSKFCKENFHKYSHKPRNLQKSQKFFTIRYVHYIFNTIWRSFQYFFRPLSLFVLLFICELVAIP